MSTHTYHFQYKKKNIQNYPKSAAMGFFLGTQERVRNSRDKRAISVRATEVDVINRMIVQSNVICCLSLLGFSSLWWFENKEK